MIDTAGYRAKRLSVLAAIGFVGGVVAAAALFVAAYAYRYGVIDYGFALLTIMQYAAYLGGAAALFALLGLGASLPGGARNGAVLALVGVVAGGGAFGYVGYMYDTVRTVPFIHDVSTDTENPPEFVAVIPVREEYGAERGEAMNPFDYSAEVALQQRAGYPDIQPLIVQADPDEVFERAEALARALEWEVVEADAAAGRIEAVATTRWYKFKDDVVLRLTPTGEGTNVRTRVDMRSASRVGRSDVGANANRIREFLGALDGVLR